MKPEYVKAWQCIGCGRIESQETCIGICQDKPQAFVYASEHEAALAAARAETERLARIVRQLAWSAPRNGEWERSFRALQDQARRALHDVAPAMGEPDQAAA